MDAALSIILVNYSKVMFLGGLVGFLEVFWFGMEDFGEWGPDWEISGRDLAFGRGKGWGEGADMG